MKTLLLIVCAACITIAGVAPQQSAPVAKNLAQVNEVDGYYIFQQCKPMREYEVLGEVKKTGITWTGSPKEMFKTLLRRTKKDFPKADGLIFEDVQVEHAQCIKFKD
jgi:hypothetical protein